jgi:hypothetical protein
MLLELSLVVHILGWYNGDAIKTDSLQSWCGESERVGSFLRSLVWGGKKTWQAKLYPRSWSGGKTRECVCDQQDLRRLSMCLKNARSDHWNPPYFDPSCGFLLPRLAPNHGKFFGEAIISADVGAISLSWLCFIVWIISFGMIADLSGMNSQMVAWYIPD